MVALQESVVSTAVQVFIYSSILQILLPRQIIELSIYRLLLNSDNCLQLENEIYLSGKKKSPTKMITGLQFSPIEPQKLMVTCADSRITILDRSGVIRKYKGKNVICLFSSLTHSVTCPVV